MLAQQAFEASELRGNTGEGARSLSGQVRVKTITIR